MTKSDEGFVASKGWLDIFKHQHGIRRLKITGEKLSSNESAIEPFRIELLRFINQKNLSAEQMYNADESGLFWRMLRNKTLADHYEKVVSGRKSIKVRITFTPCANATGKHKPSLFVAGTAKKSRTFKSVMLPLCYRGQKNAWATRELFLDWFKTEFVPAVQQLMKSINLPQRALLLLDNCPGNPSAEELCTDDDEIFAMFLHPNTTALIQPMDHNAIQNIKLEYRKLLLTNILNDPVHIENLGKKH
ncbi:Jerky -like [Araneus ventricosus]|uniref:Jerky-like n=1 Tax=Araneus ventricosus TaxID=182803 RepID=A0A4Y2D5R5_ARAVE|nr:Jerky -like [Araneus ventricosus]